MGASHLHDFHRRRLAGLLVPLMLAVLPAGCSFFAGPPPETYQLLAPYSQAGGSGSTRAQILVPEATPLKALDTDRIVVVKGIQLSYYPDAQWPDRLPRVIQAKIVEALERSGRVRAAGRPGEGLSIDYQLLTDIRAFDYSVGQNGGIARVDFQVRLMNDRDGRIIARDEFSATVPVAADDAASVVTALDAALDSVLVDVVRWVVRKV